METPRERTNILPVFKYAPSKGYIIKLPESEASKAKSESRPTFTTAEWKTIRDASPAWGRSALRKIIQAAKISGQDWSAKGNRR